MRKTRAPWIVAIAAAARRRATMAGRAADVDRRGVELVIFVLLYCYCARINIKGKNIGLMTFEHDDDIYKTGTFRLNYVRLASGTQALV
jgi:hypothetical protein